MKDRIQEILSNNPGASIFLTGPPNSRKTTSMMEVLQEMELKPQTAAFMPFEAARVPLHTLMHNNVLIDGISGQSDAFDLLLLRLNKGLRTFVTSDVNPKTIPDHYWQKIQSRMTVINLWPESSPSSPDTTPENTNIFSSLLKFIQK